MTDFQLMKRLRGDRQDQPKNSPAPRLDGPPRLSEKAALVAQQMESLEVELSSAVARGQDMENRAIVAEQQLEKTEDKLAAMQVERDYFQRRFLETNAKLRAGAGVILDCIKESEKDVDAAQAKDAYRPKQDAQRAVARALSAEEEGEQNPIPEFLHQKSED